MPLVNNYAHPSHSCAGRDIKAVSGSLGGTPLRVVHHAPGEPAGWAQADNVG